MPQAGGRRTWLLRMKYRQMLIAASLDLYTYDYKRISMQHNALWQNPV